MLRAVIHDREMSMAVGINVSRVYLVTFTVGAMLARWAARSRRPPPRCSPASARR